MNSIDIGGQNTGTRSREAPGGTAPCVCNEAGASHG